MNDPMSGIELATYTYTTCLQHLRALRAGQERGQVVDDLDIWLYTNMAQEAASLLAKAWQREASRLHKQAMDALPAGL